MSPGVSSKGLKNCHIENMLPPCHQNWIVRSLWRWNILIHLEWFDMKRGSFCGRTWRSVLPWWTRVRESYGNLLAGSLEPQLQATATNVNIYKQKIRRLVFFLGYGYFPWFEIWRKIHLPNMAGLGGAWKIVTKHQASVRRWRWSWAKQIF